MSTPVGKTLQRLLAAAILVLSLTLLAGCASTPSEYVGTWVGSTNVTGGDGLVYKSEVDLKLAEDGSFDMSVMQRGRWLGTNYGGKEYRGSWDAVGDTLTLRTVDANDNSKRVTYKFTIGSDGQQMAESGNYNLVLAKQ